MKHCPHTKSRSLNTKMILSGRYDVIIQCIWRHQFIMNVKISTNQNQALGFWPNSCRSLFMVSGQSFSLSRVFLILGITHFLLFLREIWNGERKRLNHVLSTDNQNKKLTVPSHIMFWLFSAKVCLFFIYRLQK